MAMMQKDYKLIADCISEQLFYNITDGSEASKATKHTLEVTANLLANIFEHADLSFNKEKFMQTAISRSAL
jgi:hypothetical protein